MSELTKNEFQLMLKAFNKLVESTPIIETIKTELLELKKSALESSELNHRQVTAITERCDNYINGKYGNTKTKENLTYQS